MVRNPRLKLTEPVAVPDPPPRRRILYSTALDGPLPTLLGRPHYSYRFAEAKFLAAFAAAGVDTQAVAMPEYHASVASLPGPAARDPAEPLIHLIFRPTEQIRLLKPARNIACVAWEFAVLKDWTAPGEHPFLNQVRMLSLCDEIWVPCRFTRDVLLSHGISNVHVVPAPVAGPTRPMPTRLDALTLLGTVGVVPLIANFLMARADLTAEATARGNTLMDVLAPPQPTDAAPLVYLTILNPEDFRKNLDALLRGFHHFQQEVPAARLIVKVLTSADRFSLERVVSEVLPGKLADGSVFATDAIVFLNRFLTESEMSALYALADFYLCTSLAEGQNLPLLEAMAHGVVPVTTANTAMADYITPENAFVIETDRVPAPTRHLAGAIAGRPYEVDLCDARQVHAALLRSAQARPAARQRRATASMAAVRSGFGPDRVWSRIAARLSEMPGPQRRVA